jgi:hypothetical protein
LVEFGSLNDAFSNSGYFSAVQYYGDREDSIEMEVKEEDVAYFWSVSLKFPPWIERNHQET